MKKVGTSELSPEIILKCSHPYSSSIDFKVEPGVCDNGWNYNLVSNVHKNHVISRHNSIEHFVLHHNKYDITLKEWLALTENKRENNWCDVYWKWNVCRPKEEARQIIQGILQAVYELYSRDSFHGFLYHLENFAIRDSDLMIEGHHTKTKQVFLIHENLIPKNQSDNNSQLGDKLAVSNVIFDQILGASTSPNGWFPRDLQHLRDLLNKCTVNSDDWKLIANHPSLWHWTSRFSYIEKVQSHYVNAIPNSPTFEYMKSGFSKISVSGWKEKILDDSLKDSPFKTVYTFKKNSYGQQEEEGKQEEGKQEEEGKQQKGKQQEEGKHKEKENRNSKKKEKQQEGKQKQQEEEKQQEEKAEDLLRYFRNVRAHYKEHVERYSYDYKYLNQQFIELNITKVSELFLVNLYHMCQDTIEI